MLTRRHALLGAGAALPAIALSVDAPKAAAPLASPGPSTGPSSGPSSGLSSVLWPTAPIDQLRDLLRVMGDLSGQKVFSAAQGEILAALPGRTPQFMARWGAVRVSILTPQASGEVEHRYWSALFPLDERDQPFETYKNPLNGAVGKPSYRYGGPSRALFTPRGVRYAGPDGQIKPENPLSNGFLDPFVLPWAAVGDVGWVDYQTPFTLMGGVYNDHSKYRFSMAEFADRKRTSIASEYHYYGESPFYPWMQMGKSSGNLRWQAQGFKTSSIAALPAALRTLCERFHPGLLEKPETFDKRDTRGA